MTTHARLMLEEAWGQKKFVCVGVDPALNTVPVSTRVRTRFTPEPESAAITLFCLELVEATKDVAAAYKLNLAFFLDELGWRERVLVPLTREIKRMAPRALLILDGKFSEVQSSGSKQAAFVFETLQADAVTAIAHVSGSNSLEPFLAYRDKLTFVWCQPSSGGTDEFKNLWLGQEMLYEYVARRIQETWNRNGNCGAIVGATHLERAQRIREIIGDDIPILSPGFGAQGGRAKSAARALANKKKEGFLASASRSIMRAPSQRDAARALHKEIIDAL